jgi:uncharacterized protein (TIGR02266 family)
MHTGAAMENDRRTPRIEVHLEIEYHDAGGFVRTCMRNLSAGGVFIQTDTPLPADSQFAVRMQLPGDEELMEAQCRVVWTKHGSSCYPTGMGVQFLELLPGHLRKITSFIKAHLPDNRQ